MPTILQTQTDKKKTNCWFNKAHCYTMQAFSFSLGLAVYINQKYNCIIIFVCESDLEVVESRLRGKAFEQVSFIRYAYNVNNSCKLYNILVKNLIISEPKTGLDERCVMGSMVYVQSY